jgi:predicted kinase
MFPMDPLTTSRGVFVDAVHSHPLERDAIAATANDAGVCFAGLWLEAPVSLMSARVRARVEDASDATEAVVQKQARYETGPINWYRLSATNELGRLATRSKSWLANSNAMPKLTA